MKATKTHVQIAHESRLSVGEEIREMTSISDFYRKLIIYTAGCYFLENQYPNTSEQLMTYRSQLERSANFWKWFRQEWYQWEQDLLSYVVENKVDLTEDMYWNEMIILIHDEYTQQAYAMFLKIFKNRL